MSLQPEMGIWLTIRAMNDRLKLGSCKAGENVRVWVFLVEASPDPNTPFVRDSRVNGGPRSRTRRSRSISN